MCGCVIVCTCAHQGVPLCTYRSVICILGQRHWYRQTRQAKPRCSSPPPIPPSLALSLSLSLPACVLPISTHDALWPAFWSLGLSSSVALKMLLSLSLSLSLPLSRIKAALYPTKTNDDVSLLLTLPGLNDWAEDRGWGGIYLLQWGWPARHKWALASVCVCVCVCVCVWCVGDGWDPAVLVSADIICPSCCTPLTVYNKLSLSLSLSAPPPLLSWSLSLSHSLLMSLSLSLSFSLLLCGDGWCRLSSEAEREMNIMARKRTNNNNKISSDRIIGWMTLWDDLLGISSLIHLKLF